MTTTPIILIVDDDEGHALLIRQYLEDAGVTNRIERFGDGQTFLEFCFEKTGQRGHSAETASAYLVLLDMRMPKVDGIEVLRRLKLDGRLKNLPVIMLTTSDDASDVDVCYALGCSAYIQKPIDQGHFAEAVRRLGQFTQLLLIPPIKSQ